MASGILGYAVLGCKRNYNSSAKACKVHLISKLQRFVAFKALLQMLC